MTRPTRTKPKRQVYLRACTFPRRSRVGLGGRTRLENNGIPGLRPFPGGIRSIFFGVARGWHPDRIANEYESRGKKKGPSRRGSGRKTMVVRREEVGIGYPSTTGRASYAGGGGGGEPVEGEWGGLGPVTKEKPERPLRNIKKWTLRRDAGRHGVLPGEDLASPGGDERNTEMTVQSPVGKPEKNGEPGGFKPYWWTGGLSLEGLPKIPGERSSVGGCPKLLGDLHSKMHKRCQRGNPSINSYSSRQRP